MSLWPNTLARFWGAHALAWGCGTAVLSLLPVMLGTSVLGVWAGATPSLLALASANLALAALLYRNREEAGFTLSATGAGYPALWNVGSCRRFVKRDPGYGP